MSFTWTIDNLVELCMNERFNGYVLTCLIPFCIVNMVFLHDQDYLYVRVVF